MTNQQANTVINLLRDIYTRLGLSLTEQGSIDTNTNNILIALNNFITDFADYVSFLDNWFILVYDARYPILFSLLLILVVSIIRSGKDYRG